MTQTADLAGQIRQRLAAGQLSSHQKLGIARGMIPLPPDQLATLLLDLYKDSDEEVKSAALETLGEMPGSILEAVVAAAETSGGVLDGFARLFVVLERADLVRKVVGNRNAPEHTWQFLAAHAPRAVLDEMADNQDRLFRNPMLIDLMIRNSAASPALRRRLDQLKLELSQWGDSTPGTSTPAKAPPELPAMAPRPAAGRPAAPGIDVALPDDLPDLEDDLSEPAPVETRTQTLPGADGAAAAPESISLDDVPRDLEQDEDGGAPALDLEDIEDENRPLAFRIRTMTVAERIALALKGGREERAILIRDKVKQVAFTVLKNARMTDTEAETLAKMRSLDVDILREMARHREWLKRYLFVFNLVQNPKTPADVSLPLLNRLYERDLKNIQRNKDVPEVIRNAARRAAQLRAKRKDPGE
ncbi:MAG: hypothetical protein HYV63_16000 [Candidatus Schekmanbacteria bacterium]|nr:hypothetical protein [Candidatus Schekmanbacteria bacterium]